MRTPLHRRKRQMSPQHTHTHTLERSSTVGIYGHNTIILLRFQCVMILKYTNHRPPDGTAPWLPCAGILWAWHRSSHCRLKWRTPLRHFRLIYVFAVLNQKVKRNAASTRAGYAFPAMACWSLLCACRVFAEHVGEIRTGAPLETILGYRISAPTPRRALALGRLRP